MAPTDRGRGLRALHVCTRYLRGGSERRLQDIVTALPEVDHDVTVGDESDLGLAREQLAPAAVSLEPDLVRAIAPSRDLRAFVRLVRRLRAGPYDVVYTHQSKAGAVGRAAAWLAGGPPTVHSLSMANVGPGYGRAENVVFHGVERVLASRTAAYAVVGRDLAARFERLGVPADRLHVVRSGVALPYPTARPEARARLAEQYGVPMDRPLLLSLGSLDRRKNVLSLPDLVLEVGRRTGRRPFLLVAGDGPLQGPLSAALADAGLGRDSLLLGHVSPVDDLVAGADVLVLLSSAEGVPQVLVQAAAVGTPFVAYRVDGVAELFELGSSGTAVDVHDLVGAAAAVADTIHRGRPPSHDPTLAGQRVRDVWSPEAIRRGHRALFEVATGIRLPPRAEVPLSAGRHLRSPSSGSRAG